VAPTAVATVRGHQHAAEATTGSTGGLLAINGIQSRTLGLELAWGRTPVEVSCIFYFRNLFSVFIYLLAFKKLKTQKYHKNMIKIPKIFIPLLNVLKECLVSHMLK